MTATKTKEFLSEMKVLCKSHHANLVTFFFLLKKKAFDLILELLKIESYVFLNFVKVELIGYAASHEELFLIHEYAQKGSLGSHLHDPQIRGKIMHHRFVV